MMSRDFILLIKHSSNYLKLSKYSENVENVKNVLNECSKKNV